MKIIGIVCEYNPFHNGHLKQLRLIRERYGAETGIVCLMSGNFVQRGAPALFDKTVRARAAVESGADLVLELPVTVALRSAEGFADGGVAILDALGCEVLCFGCECGDGNLIMSTAERLLTPEFDALLREELAAGVSFAKAREKAFARMTEPKALRSPNDILAVEYCKAILRRGSRMEIFAIPRLGDYHGKAADPENPAASFLRACMESGFAEQASCSRKSDADKLSALQASVPPQAVALYETAPRYTMAAGERAVLARVRTLPDEAFEALPFGAEGLWRKLMRACRTERSVEAILEATKSKRYARTRIQRMLLCAYLGLTENDLKREIPYVRILAFHDTGRKILRQIDSHNVGAIHEPPDVGSSDQGAICESPLRIPLVNAGSQPPDEDFYALECRCADLYTLFCTDETRLFCGAEQKNRIFYQDLEKNTCKTESVVL